MIAVFRPERIILPGCNQSATFLHLQEHDKRLSSSLISPHQFHPIPVANARLITPRLPASTRLPGTLFLRQSFLQLYFQTIKPWRFTTFHDCSSRTSRATFSTRQTLRFPATNSLRNELEPILATKSRLIYIWSIFRARSPRSSPRRFEFKCPAAKFITKPRRKVESNTVPRHSSLSTARSREDRGHRIRSSRIRKMKNFCKERSRGAGLLDKC